LAVNALSTYPYVAQQSLEAEKVSEMGKSRIVGRLAPWMRRILGLPALVLLLALIGLIVYQQAARQESLDRDLLWAIDSGFRDEVRALLKSGANPNARYRRDDQEENLLQRISRLLFRRGEARELGERALHCAARSGQIGTLKLLIERGAPVRDPEDREEKLLLAGCESGKVEMVKALLDLGLDPNERNQYSSAIERAIWWGNPKMVQLLIDRGANLSAGGTSITAQSSLVSVSLLRVARERGNPEIIRILKRAGAR
jgi:ankyrin repeat protein